MYKQAKDKEILFCLLNLNSKDEQAHCISLTNPKQKIIRAVKHPSTALLISIILSFRCL